MDMMTKVDQKIEKSPSGISILWRELVRDKLGFISFIFIVLVTLFVFIGTAVIDHEEVSKINLHNIYSPPTSDNWLGTDYGGRDVLGQLIIGTRNSLAIGFAVTIMAGILGITVGLVSGYYGGQVDNGIMRVVDFFMILPFLMIVIVFVAIVPTYTIVTFSLIMTVFLWMGTARLIRSRTLQEKELDYIKASKTLGTPNRKIMFKQVLPNLSSLIIVTMTLDLAGNIGIESGLSFLGFGFPESTPSLGTLLSYATNPQTLEYRWWIWLPAALLILLLMLSVNNVGQTLKRATDARQRRG